MSGCFLQMIAPEDRPLIDEWRKTVAGLWHWFNFQFQGGPMPEVMHAFALDVTRRCREVDAKIPGFANEFMRRLGSLCGREKYEPHYEQLLQQLAELVVIRQVTTFSWPAGTTFEYEPPSSTSKKNPELVVRCPDFRLGIEVKCPALLEHLRLRAANSQQMTARLPIRDTLAGLSNTGQVTLPRDNPLKDFLVSAQAKFEGHKATDPDFYSVLIVVWDDFIYEPIAALRNSASGLLTPNSFFKKDGVPVTFPALDGVVLIRHLHLLQMATRDENMANGQWSAFDYGSPNEDPFKALIAMPDAPRALPEEAIECLQAVPIEQLIGAEYQPLDTVMWIKTRDPKWNEPLAEKPTLPEGEGPPV